MRFDPKVKPEVFACKDSTREHLTRVQLDCEHRRLVATNGHAMIVTPVEDCDDDHTGPIDPAVLIAARKATKYMPSLAANGCVKLPDGTTYLRPGDAADFPPWQNVMPAKDRQVRARIGVNAGYLADIAKACGRDAIVTMSIAGELDPIEFRVTTELGETTIIIMPCRI